MSVIIHEETEAQNLCALLRIPNQWTQRNFFSHELATLLAKVPILLSLKDF